MNKKIRVALIAPSFGDIGGPEIAVQNLADAFLELGVAVTLFAPADWKTKAQHIPTLKQSLWNMKNFTKQNLLARRNYLTASQVKVLNYQNDFDIIHLNSQRYAYTVAANANKPCVLSFHNKIMPWQYEQLKELPNIYFVSLTNFQKGNFKTSATIYNGIPIKKIPYSYEKEGYFMCIGRIIDQKGIDLSIQIARKSNKKLLIFGRLGSTAERVSYYKNKIKPYLDKKNIVYKGEVPHKKIYDYLKNAEALLFTPRRPEAFGLVSIEALACGTPVIGTKTKPLTEILKNHKVSFLSNNMDQLIDWAKNTDRFDRKECRRYAEKKFDSLVMAKKYLRLYEKILQKKK